MTEPDVAVDAPPPGALRHALDRLASLSIGIAAAALLGLVVVQGWQVFARYVINDSPSWTEPVTILLLATAMSFGAAAGVHSGRHFGFYLLADAMGRAVRRVVDVLACAVMVAIGAVLAWWGSMLLLSGLDVRMAGAPLPQSLPYLPLAVGGALIAVFALARAMDVLTTEAAPLPAMPVAATPPVSAASPARVGSSPAVVPHPADRGDR